MFRTAATAITTAAFSAGLAHFMFSAAAVFLMLTYDHRMFDLRQFPDESDMPYLSGGYLAETAGPESTVVVGSSFSFGYAFPAEMAFPFFMGDGVINASIIGADLARITTTTLCEMRVRAIRPKAIVLEIPLVNEVSRLTKKEAAAIECPEIAHPTLMRFALSQPLSMQWFDLLNDPYSDRRDRTIAIQKLPDDYFISRNDFLIVKDEFEKRIEDVYRLSSQISEQVFLFITPVYLPGVSEAGDDPEIVREQIEFAVEVCRRLAQGRCIDMSAMLNVPDYFANITHLNGVGAKYLGNYVAEKLIDPW